MFYTSLVNSYIYQSFLLVFNILCEVLYNFIIVATLVVRIVFIFLMKEPADLVYGLSKRFPGQCNDQPLLSAHMLHHVTLLFCYSPILAVVWQTSSYICTNVTWYVFEHSNVAAQNKGFSYCLLSGHWQRI